LEIREAGNIRKIMLSRFRQRYDLNNVTAIEAYFHSHFYVGMPVNEFKIMTAVMRGRVICPNHGYGLFVSTSRDHVTDVSFRTSVYQGVAIFNNGKLQGHLGDAKREIAYRLSAAAWKSRALDLLREHQQTAPSVKGRGLEIIGTAKTIIPFRRPNLIRRMVHGFRVCAVIGASYIYSRSGRYTMEDPRDDGRSTITALQTKILDDHPTARYVFTSKGLAKVWIDNDKRTDWQRVMARMLGMSYSVATSVMRKWYDYDGPDVVLERIGDLPYNERPGQVVHHFEEVPVLEPRLAPARSLPGTVSAKRHVTFQSSMVVNEPNVVMPRNVDLRPVTFQMMFGDFHVVARDSTKADIEVNPGPAGPINTPALILAQATPSTDTPAAEWFARFYDNETWEADATEGLESVMNDYQPKWVHPHPGMEVDDEMAGTHSDHDGRRADNYETNEAIRISRHLNRKRRFAFRAKLDELFESAEHPDVHDSRKHDIEKNPGPGSQTTEEPKRGRSPHTRSQSEGSLLRVDTGESSSLGKGKERERTPSRIRSPFRAIKSMLSMTRTEIELLREQLGFNRDTGAVEPHLEIVPGSELDICYQGHVTVGHLPGDKRYTKPRRWWGWEHVWSAEDQAVLDTQVGNENRFERGDANQLAQLTHRYFQRTDCTVMGRREVAAFAHCVKALFACPAMSVGFALEFVLANNEIVLHYTTEPTEHTAGRMWYYVNGDKYFHGGDDREDNQRLSKDKRVKAFVEGDLVIGRYELPPMGRLRPDENLAGTQEKLDNIQGCQWVNLSIVTPADAVVKLLGCCVGRTEPITSVYHLVEVFTEFKLWCNCPSSGAYVIRFNDELTSIELFETKRLTEENRERCWVMVGDRVLFHLGRDDPCSSFDDDEYDSEDMMTMHRNKMSYPLVENKDLNLRPSDVICARKFNDFETKGSHFDFAFVEHEQQIIDQTAIIHPGLADHNAVRFLELFCDLFEERCRDVIDPRGFASIVKTMKTHYACPSRGVWLVYVDTRTSIVYLARSMKESNSQYWAQCWFGHSHIAWWHMGRSCTHDDPGALLPIIEHEGPLSIDGKPTGRPSWSAAKLLAYDLVKTISPLPLCQDLKVSSVPNFEPALNLTRRDITEEDLTTVPPILYCWLYVLEKKTVFWLTIFFYIKLWFSMFTEFRYPVINGLSANVTFPDDDFDDDFGRRAETFAVVTLGTEGDVRPMMLAAQVAGHYGIPTVVRRVRDMNGDDMERLRCGDVLSYAPDYATIANMKSEGYKRILAPHVEISMFDGLSYSLAPTSHWIHPPRFVDDWSKVKWIDYLPAVMMEKMNAIFSPYLRVGCLRKGSNFPRTVDGLHPLTRKSNLDQTGSRTGWLSGSNNVGVIPSDIREKYEQIPTGDHSEIFRQYSKIYMHGGAGTVQTAIACGCEVVVCDPTMDRNYHTLPTPADYRLPSISPLMGYLVLSGFKPNAPLEVKVWWVISFLWNGKMWLFLQLTDYAVKLIAMLLSLMTAWKLLLTFYVAVPLVVIRLLLREHSVLSLIKLALWVLWEFPFFCLGQSFGAVPLCLWAVRKVWVRLVGDFLCVTRPRFKLEFEAAKLNKGKMPFPFGHWSVLDTKTELRYEGQFVKNSRHTIGGIFKFVRVKRKVSKASVSVPVPFNLDRAARIAIRGDLKGEYSAQFNCLTMIEDLVSTHSFFFWLILKFSKTAVWFALQPPETIMSWMERLGYDATNYKSSRLYQTLGFAASVEDVPLELDDEVEEHANDKPNPTEEPGLRPSDDEVILAALDEDHDEEMQTVARELIALSAIVSSQYEVTEEVTREIVQDAMLRRMIQNPLPDDDPLICPKKDGEVIRTHLGDIIDAIHHAMSFVRNTRAGDAFIAYIKGVAVRIHEFIQPLLNVFTKVLILGYVLGERYFRNFFCAVSDLISYVYGLENSKRIKTAWGLTGLYRTGFASMKARLAVEIAHAELMPRIHPVDDFNHRIAKINEMGEKLGLGDPKHVGGPQRRPIIFKNQLMTKREGDLTKWSPDEYVRDADYEERVEAKIAAGVPQGSDGVRIAKHYPDKIARSIDRYEPAYAKPRPEEVAFANEAAESFFDDHPELMGNCGITMPSAIRQYNKPKLKYRPGMFFSGPDGFRTREAAKNAGYFKISDAIILENLKSGKLWLPYYTAFVKSQIIDAAKCLPVSDGGKDKDLRTVIAQDDFSYMQGQVVMMDRNKRDWSTHLGAGAGMRLNQSMLKHFLKIEEAHDLYEGLYMMADATAFDSTIPNIINCCHERLWTKGFENHPSGNGKNLASVAIQATWSRTKGFTYGLTEPEHSAVKAVVPDRGIRDSLVKYDPDRFIDATVLPCTTVTEMISNGETLGKVLLVAAHSQANIPADVKDLGAFVQCRDEEIESLSTAYHHKQTFYYSSRGFSIAPRQGGRVIPQTMYEDLAKFADAPVAMVSNMHYKNRGGATGDLETTAFNTVSLQLIYRMAWAMTMSRPPAEFLQYNTLRNTGDDAIWGSFGKYGIRTYEHMKRFQEICAQMGVYMTIEATKDITKVEYLSKFVRRPTPTDADDLAVWRRHKINEAIHRARQLGRDPKTLDFSILNNPKYVVYHSTPALWLRSTGLRYYQANKNTWRTVSMKRTAGHANNCAFAPDTYLSFAEEWVQDANKLLEQHNIWRRYRVDPTRGKYKLPEVVQINPTAGLQSLSPRQKAFLAELKGMMFPSYLKVMSVHMNTADVDPEAHDKLFLKLDKTWKGPNEIVAEFADQLQAFTDAIPDDYRKFMTGPSLQFAEKTFYTRNMLLEKFTYKQMLLESGDDEITFGDFSERIRRGPYACATDPYGFFERKNNDPEFLKEVHDCNEWMIQGLVFWITFIYALTPIVESFILSFWVLGPMYKLWMWSFFGLGKLYALMNTLYWHSKANSSAEISRMMPKDPYLISKRACVFIVDLFPATAGFIMMAPCAVVNIIPELLEAIGKINFKATQMKEPDTGNMPTENTWSRYAENYLDTLWDSPTRCAYLAADTGTGKSSWWIAALYGARRHKNIRHVWVISPYKSLRDNVSVPFGIKTQILQKGIELNDDFVKSATYGHFAQARINQIDPDRDVVLFDEFHLQTMEIINALHFNPARTFLLSATPANIPALRGTPSLFPDIKRRFQPEIRLYDDNMDVVDAYKEAEQLWPHVMKKPQPRVLIVVPTIRQQSDTITLLQDLLPSGTKINPYSRLHRQEPPEGIIVATQYVDVGTDFKNPPDVLIDSGKQVLIDRGRAQFPLPWTSPDTDKQRQGRVARKGPGYVFKPHSAGTGPKGVSYSSPSYFAFRHVAKHFGVQQLGCAPRPACRNMPWLAFNEPDIEISEKKSIAMLHAMAYAGVKESQWQKMYNVKREGKPLGDDYDFVERTFKDYQWYGVSLLPYDQARMSYNRPDVTSTFFISQAEEGRRIEKKGRPFKPIGHLWIQYGSTLEEGDNVHVHRTDVNSSLWGRLSSDLGRTRKALLKLASKMPSDNRLEILNELTGYA
jgi:hypothetical protein